MSRWRGGAGAFVAGALVLACVAAVRAPAGGPEPGPVVLGTFDSRAVAVAWVRSADFASYLAGLHQELDAARARGDDARVAELQALGPELQRQAHLQGFSTAPVDDIVARIADRLPAIADSAGVDVIVSKWVLAWQRPGLATVDVTDPMVACFDPSEATWTSVHEIVKQEPVPADQIEDDD